MTPLKALSLGPGIELPVNAVTQKLAWLGRTGSGKTYGASKLAEEMIDAGAQVVILDAVGVWYGLRLAADGKAKGIEIPVFGGLHGDVPLEPTGGQLVADLIVDRGLSVVIDVSQFEHDTDKARFATAWADRFFFRKKAAPSAVHVFLEECQEFVPQNKEKGEERMLHAFQRLAKLGRNFGVGLSLISQRPQEVNKKALNQTECLFAFQMTGTHERAAVEAWIADKAIDEDISAMLPKLEIGQAHVWSPAWLKISKTVRISTKRTFNASSTPEVGRRASVRELAPIDLAQLRSQMAATIERAKAEDPRELRAEVARLRAELKRLEKTQPAAPTPEVVEKPVLKDAQVKRLEAAVERLRLGSATLLKAHARQVEQLSQRMQVVVTEAGMLRDQIRAATGAAAREAPRQGAFAGGGGSASADRVAVGSSRPAPVVPRVPRVNAEGNGSGDISGPQQKILNAAAFLESIGVQQPDVVQLALFAGMSATGGYWRANIGRVRTLGLMQGAFLTDAGRAVAQPSDITTVEQLHQHVFNNLLTGPQRAILRVLIAAYPDGLSSEEVGQKANLEPGGGYWRANLGRLRSLRLVAKGSPLRALPVLFLEG